ncbi:MAG: hypothetical protein ACI399_03980 [Candidatus Cryptobacteroides sp.]
MKRILLAFAALLALSPLKAATGYPDSIYVGGQRHHVQGIAYDSEKDCLYLSFTSRFLKVDRNGKVLASIDRIQGHLGAICFNPQDRKVYASLECKDDEIGAGIARSLSVSTVSRADTRFYIAIIDVDRLEGTGCDPENSEVFRSVCLRKVVEDYSACGKDGAPHRYACSGIDGVTVAPGIAHPSPARYGRRAGEAVPEKLFLYVAYGIYGDKTRSDNDYQVIQCYDLEELEALSRPLIYGDAHDSGPAGPLKEYFIFTGNTDYGVQNLAYDPYTDCFFMAVYPGKKEEFPNYSLFAFRRGQKPFKASLRGGSDRSRHLQLSLVEAEEPYFINPMYDSSTAVSGWRFPLGSTGLCPLGDGLWFISSNSRSPQDGESCSALLFKWSGNPEGPFTRVLP